MNAQVETRQYTADMGSKGTYTSVVMKVERVRPHGRGRWEWGEQR